MEERKTAFELCLTCPMKSGFSIRDNGWWSPICKSWNKSKTQWKENIYYGPKEDCIYKLEHIVLDTRKQFNIKDANLYLMFLNYIEMNKLYFDIQLIAIKKPGTAPDEYSAKFKRLFFIESQEVKIKKSKTILELVSEINNVLLKTELANIKCHMKYHQIIRKDNKWELELIDGRG